MMSKKHPKTPDFDGDFSFLGQPAAQQEPTEPAAELPVIAPIVTPASKPAPKPVAAKPVAPLPQPPAPPAPVAPAATTAPPAASSKRSRSSVDIPVDFSFLGQPAAQQEPTEPAAELPVIAPTATPAPKPAAKPVAAKPAEPPRQPPAPPQPAAAAPPAPVAPAATTAPPAASSKRNRSSVDIPVDFSFLGQPAAQQDTPEPEAELPVIAPIVTPAPKPAPKPVAAKPVAPPPQPPAPPQPATAAPPASVAPAATTAPPVASSKRSRSSVDIPVDFSFLGQPAAQQHPPEPKLELPVIAPLVTPTPRSAAEPVAAEPVAAEPVASLPQPPAPPQPAAAAPPAPFAPESDPAPDESVAAIPPAPPEPVAELPVIATDPVVTDSPADDSGIELAVATPEGTVECQLPGDLASDAGDSEGQYEEEPGGEPQTAASTSTFEVTPQYEETELMSKRSSPSPDFSGDFSFLNNSPQTPEPIPEPGGSVRSEIPEENVESIHSEAGAGAVTDVPPNVPSDVPPVAQSSSSKATTAAEPADGEAEASSVPARRANNISVPAWFPGYTAALTLVMLFLLLTGRIHLSSNHVLESLPDVRPLAPNEFKEVKATHQLPRGHALALGESRRFGDVVVTPLKVTREALQFEDFLTGKPAPTLTTPPAYKLYLRFENVSGNAAFPPWDAALMSHRFPPFSDDLNTLANSFLSQVTEPSDEFPERLLNYMQTMDSNFVLTGQNAGKVVAPGETLETWIASEPIPDDWNPAGPLRWRVQFRKGVNSATKNGVTTLIDVNFNVSEISG